MKTLKNNFLKTIIGFSAVVLAFSLQAQTEKSPLERARQRYPMLEVCEIPGLPSKILCGQFEVYENRETGEGRKIPIDVQIIPTTNPNPPESAYLYHPGGPGGPGGWQPYLFTGGSMAGKIKELRDVVIMDFRGTGASTIPCSVYDTLFPYAYAFVFDREMIKACLEEAREAADLTQYNTENTVEDIEEIRDWLGVKKWDISGASYGVRVAMEYQRRYAHRVRSLMLKGSIPPDFGYAKHIDQEIDNQLRRLIKRCESDPQCKANYPDFEKQVVGLKQRLNQKSQPYEYADNPFAPPVKRTLTADQYQRLLGHLFLSGSKDESIPMIVDQAYNGNFKPLIQADDDRLVIPAFLSAFCPEEIDRFSQEEASILDHLFTGGGIAREKIDACQDWMEMDRPAWLQQPIQGDIPVLIISGAHDVQTPSRLGEQVQSFYPNSRHIIFPAEGHSFTPLGFQCRYQLEYDFLKNGKLADLDVSCAQNAHRPPFSVYLTPEEMRKYEGQFASGRLELDVYQKNGRLYMYDEYGESGLIYQGNDTFYLQYCSTCTLTYEWEDGKVKHVLFKDKEEKIFSVKNK